MDGSGLSVNRAFIKVNAYVLSIRLNGIEIDENISQYKYYKKMLFD